MKKYIVKYKDREKVIGEYNSREEASEKLMNYIKNINDGLDYSYITLFDFVLEEVEEEVNEVITDFETARNVLGIKSNTEFTVVEERRSRNAIQIEDVARLVNELNPTHIEALVALNRLFTIAEAWNKADGFVPDPSDRNQYKCYPWFKYDKDAAVFVCSDALDAPSDSAADVGSLLCFKSSARAEQFGKQFIELYNKAFL